MLESDGNDETFARVAVNDPIETLNKVETAGENMNGDIMDVGNNQQTEDSAEDLAFNMPAVALIERHKNKAQPATNVPVTPENKLTREITAVNNNTHHIREEDDSFQGNSSEKPSNMPGLTTVH